MKRSHAAAGRYVEVRLARIDLERDGRTVLQDVQWTIKPGERWILAGANGAGKTQLLKLISGAVWPTTTGRESRRYRWHGETFKTPAGVLEEIAYVGPERQDKYERYGWNHTARQIVGTGLYRTDIPLNPVTVADARRIDVVLKRLAITELGERNFLTLSYGQRRLVLLARALASRPKLLLLDELMNGLDQTNRARALRWLESSRRSQLPWVLTTHRVEDVPACATHALILEAGRVVYRGVISRAPLDKWLEQPQMDDDVVSVVPRSRGNDGPIVKLIKASVYLTDHVTLEKVSMEVNPGDCWVVHGSNGSGKTTLLRTLYGDHGAAVGGRIQRKGIEPGVPLEEFKRRVGLVAPHLQTDQPLELTAAEVVQSGRYSSIGLNEPANAADRAAADRSLAFFGLSHLASRTLRELSYGQMRRVLFARAWINRPELLLLDEPFEGVDGATRRSLLTHLAELAASGVAMVIATHHRIEWPPNTTHELELEEGRVRYCGPRRSHSARQRTTRRAG